VAREIPVLDQLEHGGDRAPEADRDLLYRENLGRVRTLPVYASHRSLRAGVELDEVAA
jgi:hypothetical protein